MRKCFFSIIVFLCFTANVFAQSNEQLLRELIFTKINLIRDSLNKKPVVWDEVLNLAAENHATYMGKEKKLTHYQTKNKMKTPFNRVVQFGGQHKLVLENIAYISSSKPYTLEETAEKIVNNWVKSSGHFKNLIHGEVTQTGIGVYFHKSANTYYVAQVFAGMNELRYVEKKNPDNAYGIKNPKEEYLKKCKKCVDSFNQMPEELGFGAIAYEGVVYFYLSDADYLHYFFESAGDGVAVDVLSKVQYACGKKNKLSEVWPAKGLLLPPVYLKQIQQEALLEESGEVWIPLGEVPESMLNHELEFNLLFLRNKYLCRYQTFSDIPSHAWDLLEMGMYRPELEKQVLAEEHYVELLSEKKLTFIIPFEQGKYTYTPQDIQPIYDSLRIEKYNITQAKVEAYASVEGSEEVNHDLLAKRVDNILAVMKTFQENEIQSTVKTAENWVEFFSDIKNTKYANWTDLSTEEIKLKLQNKTVLADLEPILKKQRKAVLELSLELKEEYTLKDEVETVRIFNTLIEQGNVLEAQALQAQIHSAIKREQLPESVMDKLEVPEQASFASLLARKNVFMLETGKDSLFNTLKKFLTLDELIPDNKEIKYNIAVLRLKGWASNQIMVVPDKLKNDISVLKKYGVPSHLIDRLMINYHIILSNYAMQIRNYNLKNEALKYIYNAYRSGKWSDSELYNLAGYFVNYSRFDLATRTIESRVLQLDAEEDLIFYYLYLTITQEQYTKKQTYRNVMLNAIEKNNDKFCQLFDSFGNGGVTFQLLNNKYLKNMYCSHCE